MARSKLGAPVVLAAISMIAAVPTPPMADSHSIFGDWRRVSKLSLSLPGDPVGMNLRLRLRRGRGDQVLFELTWTEDGAEQHVRVAGAFDGRPHRRIGQAGGWMVLSRPSADAFRDHWFDQGVHSGAELCRLTRPAEQLVCDGYEVSMEGRRFRYRDVFLRAN